MTAPTFGSDGFTGPELVAWMGEHGYSASALATLTRSGERSIWRWRVKGCSFVVSNGITALGLV